MGTGRRLAILGAVVVVAIVAFIIASSGGDDDSSSSNQATTGTPTTAQQQPAAAKPVRITVQNGQPVGGIKKIKVKGGDRVRLVVDSDVADEIHIHGYDFMKDVEAAGQVRFDFPAKIEGTFEIELENRKLQIGSLQVTP